jgi:predicted MPP superfamily phosphohydrolase
MYAPVADKRFIQGLHAWKGHQIYISRGVGNIDSVRFMCRPEVAILDVGIA